MILIQRSFSRPRHRLRGSLLVEVAMGTVLLMITMTMTVKVLGWVAQERHSAERRQRALLEVANVMERISAYRFEDLTPDLARRIKLSETARGHWSDSELTVEFTDSPAGDGPPARRVALELRWRGRSGLWDRPVRLCAWIPRRKDRT
jgi:hypothetical protein